MMSREEMVNSLMNRRSQYMDEQKRKRKIIFRTTTSMCCISLVALLGFGLWQGRVSNIISSDKEVTATLYQNKDNLDKNNSVPKDFSVEGQYAVYTDSIHLPENTSDVAMDMIGCLVYRGKVYTQSDSFYDYVSDNVKQLVGEYVGEAKGTLSEWSSQEDWATELASTYSGAVYTVNGYSEDFRLCIYVNSNDGQWLQFLDNYDGIGLNTGADLFENRLHMTGNVKSVTYRTHKNWNEGDNQDYRELTAITQEQFGDFLTELCGSPFVRIDPKENPNFYDSEVQGHLYLNMNDGTCVGLRLIDGGYVTCQNLGWVFVKMPGELFDLVLAACQ